MTSASDGRAEEARSFWQAALRDAVLWLALILLLLLSLFTSAPPYTVPVQLTVAALQVVFIATFFLRLSESRALVRLAAGAAFVFLLVMFTLTFGDLYTRI